MTDNQTPGGAAVPCISLLAATQIGHWPNQDVPCCDRHADKMRAIASVIGLCVSFTPAPDGAECINCKHEANAEAQRPAVAGTLTPLVGNSGGTP